METTELEKLIKDRFPGQYKAGLELTIQDIMKMNAEVQRRTFKFLTTGEVEDVEIESYTVKKLTETGMNTLGAFLMQDWLLREPEKAKQAIKRGHDSVVPRDNLSR